MDLKAQIGRRVRELRKLRGFSQRQLADEAEMTEEGIGDIERGGSWPRAETLVRLAEALSVPVKDLFSFLLNDDASPDERAKALDQLKDTASGLGSRDINLLLTLASEMAKQDREDKARRDDVV